MLNANDKRDKLMAEELPEIEFIEICTKLHETNFTPPIIVSCPTKERAFKLRHQFHTWAKRVRKNPSLYHKDTLSTIERIYLAAPKHGTDGSWSISFDQFSTIVPGIRAQLEAQGIKFEEGEQQ